MHHNITETLLTVVTAFSAKSVVGNAISFIQKQRPLLFPLLAHSRHSNQSSFPAKNIKNHREDTLSLVCVISRGENRGKYPFLSLSKNYIRYFY